MISDADTLQTPCIVTFRIINGDCSLSAMSTDLVLNGNDDLYTAQVDSPGTYSVFYDDNCGATDCWLQSAEYTFSIDLLGLQTYWVDDMFTVTLFAFKCGNVDSTSITVQSSYPFSLAEFPSEYVDAISLIKEWNDDINTIVLYDVSGRKATEFIDKDNLDWLPNGLYIAEIL